MNHDNYCQKKKKVIFDTYAKGCFYFENIYILKNIYLTKSRKYL